MTMHDHDTQQAASYDGGVDMWPQQQQYFSVWKSSASGLSDKSPRFLTGLDWQIWADGLHTHGGEGNRSKAKRSEEKHDKGKASGNPFLDRVIGGSSIVMVYLYIVIFISIMH